MTTREEVINYSLTYKNAYLDIPFHDPNWKVIRHKESKKVFVWTYERNGNIWINLKCEPNEAHFLRELNESIIPAYHMNKTHWITVILDGSVNTDMIKGLISKSYELTL